MNMPLPFAGFSAIPSRLRLFLICTAGASFALAAPHSGLAQEEEPAPAPAEEAPEEAAEPNPDWEKLKSAAESWVKAFNSKDAAAIAALFTPDAEMEHTDGSRVAGRAEIEAYYAETFADDPESQASMEATSIRFPAPNLAIEDGTVFMTESDGEEPTPFRYTVLHARQEDGSWLMAQTRDRKVVGGEASAELDAGAALVGDWVSQTSAGNLKASFYWDDSGAYILGTMDFFAPEIEPVRTDLRIGWDSLRQTIVLWAFDAEGGHSQGTATKIGKEWVINWSGYTAGGEMTSSTNVISPIDQTRMEWTIVNKLIGKELQPDERIVFARKPPAPNISASSDSQ